MIRSLLASAAIAAGALPMAAQVASEAVPQARLAAREHFRDMQFGMFIHWGVYSQLSRGEWVMQNQSIPIDQYHWLASAFNPIKFEARAWVAAAKAAGMRYITITARHHDGFSMFRTAASPYNIIDWTSFDRDPLAELAAECRRQGITLFFYYSQLDWHHPDYFPRGQTGNASGRPDAGTWSRYLDFMDAQLTELLTNYGPIGGIWFDGMWDKPEAPWRLEQTYALIHRLQPTALIIPNHHKPPMPGEDAQTFEQDLPGSNSAGFNTSTIGALPLETSLTMNGSWGFNLTDRSWKSTEDLIRTLVRAAGHNANLLLNVGPRPDGTLQPEALSRLTEIGRWLETHGPTVYNTRAGPVSPRDWGVTTRRGDSVFVHVLDWRDELLSLPAIGGRVTRATMWRGGAVPFTQNAAGVTITLPANEGVDRIVVLTIQ